MTKRQQCLVDSPNQLSLFDLLAQEKAAQIDEPREGSLNINSRLRIALALALKAALPKSRWEIAEEMSHLLGLEISKYQIDSWVCESKEGYRIPASYIPAFCQATGSHEPLKVLNDACKVFTVKGTDALRADIRRDEETIKAKQKEMKQKVALLSALEGQAQDRKGRQ